MLPERGRVKLTKALYNAVQAKIYPKAVNLCAA
jgi:hypothetical protein